MQYIQSTSDNIALCIISNTGSLNMMTYPASMTTRSLIRQLLLDCVIPVKSWEDVVVETGDPVAQRAVSTALETLRNAK